MLFLADGRFLGLLSGGCLEADLDTHARDVLDRGEPRAVEYDMRGPDDILFGIGAGCEGAMRVLLEPAGPGTPADAALAAAVHATRSGRPACLVAVHDSTHLRLGTYDSAALSSQYLATAAQRVFAERHSHQAEFEAQGGRTRALLQYLAPPPHLLICGAGPDVQPVVAAALNLAWRVTVVDHRPAHAIAQRFPGARVVCAPARELRARVSLDACHAAVVMSHHLPSDITYLRELAEGGRPDYIGLLGPAARRRRIAEELRDTAELLRPRLRGPVGIDIGAVTPEGIALSIVAQIHGWLAGRSSDLVPSEAPGGAWHYT
jgi:xanthine/CO dehydrogenase XdhC/CoxF family maturation factor